MVMEAKIRRTVGDRSEDVHVLISGRSPRTVSSRGDAAALLTAVHLDEDTTGVSIIQSGRSGYTECPVSADQLYRMIGSRPSPFSPRCLSTPYTRELRMRNSSQPAPVSGSGYTFVRQTQGRILGRFTAFPESLPDNFSITVNLSFCLQSGGMCASSEPTISRSNPNIPIGAFISAGAYHVLMSIPDTTFSTTFNFDLLQSEVDVVNFHRLTNVPNGYVAYEFTSTSESIGSLSLFGNSENIHITRGLNRILIPLDGRDASQVNFSLSIDGREYRVQ